MLALTAGFTVVHGHLSQRWTTPAEMQKSIELVQNIPKVLGDWEYVGDGNPLGEGVLKELAVTEYASRRYSNGEEVISLLFMTGWSKRLIRHTPDICMSGGGNRFLDDPKANEFQVDERDQSLLVLPVRPPGNAGDDFACVYGFMHDGVFSATRYPRLEYHGSPVVQKIQLLCEPDPESGSRMPAAAGDFIQHLTRYCATAGSAD